MSKIMSKNGDIARPRVRAEVTGYTPGPWRCENLPAVIVGPGGCQIAATEPPELSGDVESVAQQRANARLMAVAPELLAECQRLLGLFERARIPGEITQTAEGVEQLRSAIARAKGGAQ